MGTRRPGSEVRNERWRAFLEGEITVEDMDDEEIARAQFRAADGTFRGRPPKTVPRNFAQQVSRELLKRGDSRFRRLYFEAIEVLAEIARDGEKDGDRVRAANILLERVAGKVPEKVEYSTDERPAWQDFVLRKVSGGDEADVVPIRRGRRVRPKEEP
jgi:hypothetical protein